METRTREEENETILFLPFEQTLFNTVAIFLLDERFDFVWCVVQTIQTINHSMMMKNDGRDGYVL